MRLSLRNSRINSRQPATRLKNRRLTVIIGVGLIGLVGLGLVLNIVISAGLLQAHQVSVSQQPRKIIFVHGTRLPGADGPNNSWECKPVSVSQVIGRDGFDDIKNYLLQNSPDLALKDSDFLYFSYNKNDPDKDTCNDTWQAYSTHYSNFSALLKPILEREPNTTFDIIGHSQGGALAVAWLGEGASLIERAHIHSVITLDSPLRGLQGWHVKLNLPGNVTLLKDVSLPGALCLGDTIEGFLGICRDISKTSRIVKEVIPEAPKLGNVFYLLNQRDLFVTPEDAYLDGALELAELDECRNILELCHLDVLHSEKALAAINRTLGQTYIRPDLLLNPAPQLLGKGAVSLAGPTAPPSQASVRDTLPGRWEFVSFSEAWAGFLGKDDWLEIAANGTFRFNTNTPIIGSGAGEYTWLTPSRIHLDKPGNATLDLELTGDNLTLRDVTGAFTLRLKRSTAPVSTPVPSTLCCGNPALELRGKWSAWDAWWLFGKRSYETSTAGDSATLKFRGGGIIWRTQMDVGRGSAIVSLDGQKIGEIYLRSDKYQDVTLYYNLLERYDAGTEQSEHTFKIEAQGNGLVNLNALVVLPLSQVRASRPALATPISSPTAAPTGVIICEGPTQSGGCPGPGVTVPATSTVPRTTAVPTTTSGIPFGCSGFGECPVTPTPVAGSTLPSPTTFSSAVKSGEGFCWNFMAQTGRGYEIRLKPKNSDIDLYLVKEDGAILARSNARGLASEIITWQAPFTREVRACVYGYEAGEFTLEIVPISK